AGLHNEPWRQRLSFVQSLYLPLIVEESELCQRCLIFGARNSKWSEMLKLS
ncbi:hypothetical protein BVRB_028770, partial [Beta vulgaris subsp. vulgaris]